MDDAELLHQARRGSEPAVRQLLQRHAAYLYGIARALTGRDADADDLVQDVLVAMLDSHFRGESSVRTWLVKILVRRSAMLRRTRSRKILPLHPAAGEGGAGQPGEEQAAAISRPSSAPAVDAKLDLAAMLEQLSPDHRRVIVLRELEGMSYEQMAQVLGVPRGTVESRLHRAREELRSRFKGYSE